MREMFLIYVGVRIVFRATVFVAKWVVPMWDPINVT